MLIHASPFHDAFMYNINGRANHLVLKFQSKEINNWYNEQHLLLMCLLYIETKYHYKIFIYMNIKIYFGKSILKCYLIIKL